MADPKESQDSSTSFFEDLRDLHASLTQTLHRTAIYAYIDPQNYTN